MSAALILAGVTVASAATNLWPWSLQARLLPGDPGSPDYFGQRVALDGDTLIIGDEMDDSPTSDAGSAYIFTRRNGLVWSQKAKLTGSDTTTGDHFGSAVGGSGSNVVVGAYSDDLPGQSDAGSAYVFEYDGTTWTQRAKLVASDYSSGDNFGLAADMDADTIVVGAPHNDHPVSGTDAGAAYVFARSGTNWLEQAVLLASDRSEYDYFGDAVAVEGDTLVVGAWQADNAGANFSGAAYVFVRSGTNWSQQARLVSGDILAGDSFGRSVAVSGDTIVIGADGCDAPSLSDSGAAYVFTRTDTNWTQQAKLIASDRAAYDYLGTSVSACTNLAAASTYQRLPFGAAYVFARSGTNWTEQACLVPTNVVYGHGYAKAVALSGETLAATAYADDTEAGDNAGSAYVLALDDDQDGLSDGFEQSWGSLPNDPDSDDDTLSDYDEYLAGSSPTDGGSTGFLMDGITRMDGGTGVVMTWTGLADRLYDVEQTAELTGEWSTAESDLPGAGAAISYTNTDLATNGFLRVNVRLAP
ncbi:MAG: hypothetical protein JXR37_17740 [Kiritimatiellae bacterium]|nr:hypothetical protein [Kiritimatiellia bacterium]